MVDMRDILDKKYDILKASLSFPNPKDKEKLMDSYMEVARAVNEKRYMAYVEGLEDFYYKTNNLEDEKVRLNALIKYINGYRDTFRKFNNEYKEITGLDLEDKEQYNDLAIYENRLDNIKEYLSNCNRIKSLEEEVKTYEKDLDRFTEESLNNDRVNRELEEKLLEFFMSFVHNNSFCEGLDYSDIEFELEKLKDEIRHKREELDNFYMAYESLLNQELPDSKINEYKSYVKEARMDYYTSREKEYVYRLYELISSIESEYSDVVSKREKISRIFDDRLLLRGQLEIIDEDSFMDIEKFCNNQYSVIKAEKRVIDNINDVERRIESAKEEIRGLKDKNETVDILSILNEFGIIDTYNSDNGINVSMDMDVSMNTGVDTDIDIDTGVNFDADDDADFNADSSTGNKYIDSEIGNDPAYSALLLEEDLLNDEVNESNPYGYYDFPLSEEDEVYGEISSRGYDGLEDNVIVNVEDSGDIDLESVKGIASGVMQEVIDNVMLDSEGEVSQELDGDSVVDNINASDSIDTGVSNEGDIVSEDKAEKVVNSEEVTHDSVNVKNGEDEATTTLDAEDIFANPSSTGKDDLTLTFDSDDIFLGEKEPNIIKIDTARDITDSDFEVVSDIFPSVDSGAQASEMVSSEGKDVGIVAPEASSDVDDVNVSNVQSGPPKEEMDDFFSSTEKAILNDNLEEKKLPDMDSALEGEEDIIIDEDDMTRLPNVGSIGSVKPTSSFRDIEEKKSEIGNMEVPTNGIMDQKEEVFNSSEYIEK